MASAALALGAMVIMAVPGLEPTPAAAQTISFGGLRIHVSGLGVSGGYYHHRSSRHHAGTSGRRHARRHGGDRDEETAGNAPASRVTPTPPVAATPVVEVPVTATSRPVLHGPDMEPSK